MQSTVVGLPILLYRVLACILGVMIFVTPAAFGQDEGQYPQDNDEDYYYNYYTPEQSSKEVEKEYPADNDEDYYQNYYYDYKAGKSGHYQQYYYPSDDEDGTAPPTNNGQPYPEDNDATYYRDPSSLPIPTVNQYD